MPLPRRIDPARNGDGTRQPLATEPMAHGRPPTMAEARARQRAGRRATRGHLEPVWVEARNGLPVRPYVYCGTGRDLFDGTCLFDELAS